MGILKSGVTIQSLRSVAMREHPQQWKRSGIDVEAAPGLKIVRTVTQEGSSRCRHTRA